MTLTSRGWSVAGLSVVALGLGGWSHYPGLLAVGAALFALVLLDLLAVSRPGRLRARRIVEPLQVARHGRCTATLTIVHMRRSWPVLVDGAEPVGDRLIPIAARWLRGGAPAEVGYEVPTDRRGMRVIGPARLRRLGPTGLAARVEVTGGEVTVRVVPRVLPVRAVPAGARRGQVRGDERVARGGTDLVSLREYLPGDDLRRLHWATSARTGTLMVRDDADPSQAELTVLLDDTTGSYVDEVTRLIGSAEAGFEEAVDIAAALTSAASAAGHPVRLRTVSGSVDVIEQGASAGSGRAAPALLAALADVTLSVGGVAVNADAPLDLDVVALVSGGAADQARLALQAGRGVVGVVLVVDPAGGTQVRASGPVTVLRGPRAEELLSTWDSVIAGGAA